MTDAEIRKLAHLHLNGTGDDCILNFARAVLAAHPPAAPAFDLHAAIMNIQREVTDGFDNDWMAHEAYAYGHKEARHAAAELVAAHPPAAPIQNRDDFDRGFFAGFNASGQGWNGEYPFGDFGNDPAEDPIIMQELAKARAAHAPAQDTPAPAAMQRFLDQYYKAAKSSVADDWMEAALLAKQWHCAITDRVAVTAQDTQDAKDAR